MTSCRVNESGIDEILGGHTPPVREIALALRRIILQSLPESEERTYTGWHAIGFVHPDAGYYGAVFPRDEIVKLCFEWGAHLPDPDRVLTGTQKRIRYVEVADVQEIPVAAIERLLIEAIRFQLTEKE
jgi:hypothetical protein